MKKHYQETPFGFDWGAAKITRCFSDDKKGSVTLELKTPKEDLQIHITKTGKVRIHDKQCDEWMKKDGWRKKL